MRFSNLARRSRLRRVTVASAIAAALAASVPASPAGAMYVDPSTGEIGSGITCPSGYACIYEGLSVVGDPIPEHRYYNYGSYNFVNEFGDHTIYNHQTGGARVLLCLGYNGTNCTVTIPAGYAAHGSLTPFNSIKLVP
jgi:hypothetical protein